jgi:hypothetical protein
MEKPGRYLLVLIILIFILGFIYFYLLKKNISNNLEAKSQNVKQSWQTFNDQLNERDSLLNTQVLNRTDSLYYYLGKSKSERKNESNSIEIVFDEYKINKYILKKNPNSDENISKLNNSLNILMTNYNSVVKDYNLFFSTFPNFLFAKKMNLHRAKYFEMEYGVENEDPIEKSKKFPEWAKNVDTIL